MTDTTPEGVPDGPLDFDSAAAAFDTLLTAESPTQEADPQARGEDGRFVPRSGDEPVAEDDPDDTPEDEGEDVEASDEEGTEAEETDETEDQESQFSSVSELAEALDMESDEFLNSIQIPVKIDGQETAISLADVRDGYQREAAVTQRFQQLAEQKKSFEAEQSEIRDHYTKQMQQVGALTQAMEQQLAGDYQQINWNDLRMTDPAEFAAKRQEFQERVQWIEQVKSGAGEQAKHQEAQTQQQMQQQRAAILARESDALMAKIPEWQNPDTATAEKNQIRSYMQESGFTDDEVANLFDHRALVMVRKAMLHDKGVKETAVAKKKVAKLPKLSKPGVRTKETKVSRKKSANAEKMGNLKKSGKVKDAAAMLFDML